MMTTSNMLTTMQASQTPRTSDERQALHAILSANLDHLLAASRPHLLRIAQAHGHAPDVAEDIAQETYLEALRHLDRVYSLAGFDQWLSAICRHVCQRHTHARGIQQHYQVALAPARGGDDDVIELADPLAADPFAELDQRDLVMVLDRALGYLPGQAREAVELCYLEELPQREVAARLGLTIKALETRLIRARRQLREVLSGALRDDAIALDLLPSAEPSLGWRETRIWCNDCGRTYLRGIFEPMADGHVNFRLRCPRCSPHYDIDMTDSGGFISLENLRSFKPALKRVNHTMWRYYRAGLSGDEHHCRQCHRRIAPQIVAAAEIGLRLPRQHYYVEQRCSCSRHSLSAAHGVALYGHPRLERFVAAHPRWVSDPDLRTSYQGQPAFRFTMVDIASTARCIYFADSQTLRVLAIFEEEGPAAPILSRCNT